MRNLALLTGFAALAAACGPDSRPTGPGGGDDDPGPTEPVVDEHFVDSTAIGALATDATTLYFVDGAALKAMPLAGGSATTLFTAPTGDGTTSFGGIAKIYAGDTTIAIVEELFDTAGTTTKTLRAVPKSGGPATMLATSQDSRAFLGVSFDGDFVMYSSNTSVLRVPIAGGTVKYVGESDDSIQYWIFSPLALGDQLYWAADSRIWKMAKSDTQGRGQPIAQIPGFSGMIIDASAGKFVVAVSIDIDFQSPATSVVEVDPATGTTSQPIALGEMTDNVMQVIATPDSIWAATFTGLERIPRAGGAAEHVTTTAGMFVAASADAVFASSGTGITRIEL